MSVYTSEAWQFILDLAQRQGVSPDAVTTMLNALLNGQGTMAQFYHPELGGSGQWMQGGMTMVGDMFNYGLKAKVDGLCVALSNQMFNRPGFFNFQDVVYSNGNSYSAQWWPGDLGQPSSSGSQNNMRYAVFPSSRRLAVDVNGQVTVYDTLDHQISGVSQQQGGNDSMTFSSQYGTVSVMNLPVVSGVLSMQEVWVPPTSELPVSMPIESNGDVFTKIERLADLYKKGMITDQEFTNKKTELLSKI